MRSGVPSYPSRPHKSGQARIRVNGADVYLGKFGSAESKQKYARIVAELVAGHVALTPNAPAAVAELVLAFYEWASTRYVKNGKPTSEVSLYRAALGPVVDLYGELPAKAFGPLALMACRDELSRRGHCRNKVNQHLSRIRRVWKWGVSRQIVPAEVWMALTSVEGLRKGEGIERPKVTTIPQEHIDAIRPYVLPPVWTMVQLQLWTAMRPGEVTAMRTCDVARESDALPVGVRDLCWVYCPRSHKTEHHDKHRVILLGPQAQELLLPWLRPSDPEWFIFSPREAVEFARQRRVAQAKTHKRGFRRKAHPKRAPSLVYSPHAYAHAIAAGCYKAGVPRWSPNRLRHNAATLIRQRCGIEVARIILGHSSLNVTEVYAELDLEKAVQAIREIG